MNCSFPKSARIRTRRQYQRIAQQADRHPGKCILIEARKNKSSSTKLGITASRHYGNAVKRNRFKRIVREAFRLCRTKLQVGFDLNVKPRQGAPLAKPADIQADLFKFLRLNE